MKVSELIKACENNKYLLCRQWNGLQIGVNGKAALLGYKNKYSDISHDSEAPRIISFIPCDFQTYITYKSGFI